MCIYELDRDHLDDLKACLTAVAGTPAQQVGPDEFRPGGIVGVARAPEPTGYNAAWLVLWTVPVPGTTMREGWGLAMTDGAGISVGRFPPVADEVNSLRTRGEDRKVADWQRVSPDWEQRVIPNEQQWCGYTSEADGETLRARLDDTDVPLVEKLLRTLYTEYTAKLKP